MTHPHPRATNRRSRPALSVLALSSAAVLLLAGCSAAESGEESGDRQLRVAYDWYPTCFDYAQSNPFALYGRQVLDTLLSEDPDTGEFAPYLAESWQSLDDGSTYEFTLRDDVMFSNGEELTAQVVADNFETLWSLAEQGVATTAGAYLRGYDHAEAVDEQTVRVEFTEPNAGFLQANTEGQFGIIAPESLALSAEERCADGTIGTGPFVLDKTVQDESVEYVARDGYDWAPASYGHTGASEIDRLTIQIVPEESVRAAGVIAGDYDVAYSITENGLSQAEGNGDVEAVLAPNRGVVNNLVLNTSDPVLADPAVRQAIQHGIDRQELVDTFFGGGVEAATDVVSTGHPYYTDHSDLLSFDTDLSNQLLDDAGWSLGSDGVREKDGTRLQLTLTVSESYNSDYIEYLQSRLAEIGLELELQQVSDAELTDLRTAGNWQIAIYQGAARGDADGIAAFYSSELSSWGASLAPQPHVDALLAEQATTIDTDERHRIVDEAVTEILEQAYAIPIFDSAQMVLVRTDVTGLEFPINSWEPIFYATQKG